MIKLKLNLESSTSTPIANKKVIVDLNTNQQLNILSFLQRVISVCGITDIEAEDLQLSDGEFILPHQLSSSFIHTSKLYEVIYASVSKKKKVQQKRIEKTQQKFQLKKRKQSSDKQSSQQSNSSSQLINYPMKKQKINNNQIKKSKIQSKKIPKPQIKSIQFDKLNKKRHSEESSLQLSSQQQKNVKKQKAQLLHIQNNIKLKPLQKRPNQNKSVPLNKNKKISESSSEESDVQKLQPQTYKQKVSQILSNISQRTQQLPIQNQEKPILNKKKPQKIQKIIKKPPYVPISVRNIVQKTKTKQQPTPLNTQQKTPLVQKPKQKVSFKQYQQLKWIAITKQILNKWKQVNKNNEPILTQKNQIRFKIIELDQQKFIPVNSGWITGFVNQVKKQKDLMILLEAANKASRQQNGNTQVLKNYEIPFHNMQQLQINKNTFNNSQKQILLSQQLEQQKNKIQQGIKEKNIQQKIQKVDQQQQQGKKNSQQTKNSQSIEDYICGQINYYFSQKNYSTDLFMQMHANNDKQRFIQIKLMLNFPKIKKTLNDVNKLWAYLTSDNRYASRNYELDFERRMIRKKNA